MDEKELEGEYYTLTDEEGNELEFEVIGQAEIKGVMYFAMIPVDDQPADDEYCEYVILKAEKWTMTRSSRMSPTTSTICSPMRRTTTSILRPKRASNCPAVCRSDTDLHDPWRFGGNPCTLSCGVRDMRVL